MGGGGGGGGGQPPHPPLSYKCRSIRISFRLGGLGLRSMKMAFFGGGGVGGILGGKLRLF